MEKDQLEKLVRSLLALSRETEWTEFKHNNADPEEIGEYISALANSAALTRQPSGFIIWGIDDVSHQAVGTLFKPHARKIGNQELESWLANLLTPRVDFRIHELKLEGKPLVVFEIPAASHTPVRFRETEFIRIGTYKKKIRDYPEKERSLWGIFQNRNFEADISFENVSGEQVTSLLDYPAYFDLTEQVLPSSRDAILNRFVDEKFIVPGRNGSFNITSFGAILFAKDLSRFARLSRKALRVIFYNGKNRIQTNREMPRTSGYATGFGKAVSFINDHLPLNEQIGQAFRREVRMYPEVAIRELLANTLIHQDFYINGAGPTVEVFADRIEFTNPGVPLIDPLRFIDQPPRSRNEQLAGFMRRINICEERGTGIDKALFAVEIFQLPPPDFRISSDNTIAVLYADKPFSEMTSPERIRACYQHACLKYVCNERMTNASLRKRLKIDDRNYPMASKVISETIKAGLIKIFDSGSASRRDISYVPFWS